MLHQFLVSTAECFRLRVYIIGRSFALATRFLLRSTERILRSEPQAEREWEQTQFIRHDFQALTDESLETLQVLLTSFAAEKREELLRHL